MKLQLSRIHYPVTVLGYGRRVGIWFQGCTIGCAGCMARDTWGSEAGVATSVAEVLAFIADRTTEGIDGVTISGGEPFEQPAALAELLSELQLWRAGLDAPMDLLCYSGHPLRRLQAEHQNILEGLDALVPEPFMQNRPTDLLYRGSANQSIVCLTPLGVERYGTANIEPVTGSQRRLQVAVEGEAIWYIGIPARGDLERLAERMEAHGVTQEQVSWTE